MKPSETGDLRLAMKRDWNHRALENPRWYINTLGWEQSEEEFDLSGQREFEGQVLCDLGILTDRRDPRSLRILEIGCGLGRITKYLASIFGEVCATDVSGEMIRQASIRLSDVRNVIFRETNGHDFSDFSGESFDVIFAAYVFQHIPDVAVIESNIREAFRLLRPRGVFKFVTNGVHNEEFGRMSKDTWTGTPFPEQDIRSLATGLSAQLLGVHGDGSQYCWTFMRKPVSISTEVYSPRIECVGRAEDLSNSGLTPRIGNIPLAMVVQGVDCETADINNVVVGFRNTRLIPFYAGPTSIDPGILTDGKTISIDRARIQVSVMIAETEPAGHADVFVQMSGKAPSAAVRIDLPPLERVPPLIHLVLNASTGTNDLETSAPDHSLKVVFSHAGRDSTPAMVCFQLDGAPIESFGLVYLHANALWEALIRLPAPLGGTEALVVEVDGLASPQFPITLSKSS